MSDHVQTTPAPAWIVTGPTSGIGRYAALELARRGTVILVGRDPRKLAAMKAEVESTRGNHAVSVVCDFADIRSVRRAATEIVSLDLPLAGLLNNAGIMPNGVDTNADGWDLAYATNHLGPFALTDKLIPHLPDDANVVFTCSSSEDPGCKPAVTVGFRGARYISAEASARGEWLPGGSSKPGFDAYATSKQGNLATVLGLAREIPRLHFFAVEPGFNPGSSLGRDASPMLKFLAKYVLSPVAPFIKNWSTPQRAGRLLATILTTPVQTSGVYYDEGGTPILGSVQVRDIAFGDRVVSETRSLLARVPSGSR